MHVTCMSTSHTQRMFVQMYKSLLCVLQYKAKTIVGYKQIIGSTGLFILCDTI